MAWTTRLAAISLIAAQAAALSGSTPEDLLAYPKYSVVLANEPIASASVDSLLNTAANRAEHHKAESELRTLHPQNGHDPSHGSKSGTPTRSVIMRAANGQAFLCNVPEQAPPATVSPSGTAHAAVAAQPSSRLEVEAARHQALERGLKLLEPLIGSCLYHQQNWWTYAFCYGAEIRQFHEVRSPETHLPGEDANSPSFTLGRYPYNREKGQRLEGGESAGKAVSLGSGLGAQAALSDVLAAGEPSLSNQQDDYQEPQYLSQRWDQGTVCDKTGQRRQVEVQFHCDSSGLDRIALIRENALCSYVMVIHTPRLCGEPLFAGSGKRMDLQKPLPISCRPVVKDLQRLQQKRLAAAALAAQEIAASRAEGEAHSPTSFGSPKSTDSPVKAAANTPSESASSAEAFSVDSLSKMISEALTEALNGQLGEMLGESKGQFAGITADQLEIKAIAMPQGNKNDRAAQPQVHTLKMSSLPASRNSKRRALSTSQHQELAKVYGQSYDDSDHDSEAPPAAVLRHRGTTHQMANTRPVVLVTGASRGLGLAATRILLEKPFAASVVALSRSSPPELEDLAGRYPGSLIISKGDVSKSADVQAAVDVAMQSYSRLDSLILNAGTVEPMARIASLELDQIKEAYDVNFFSLFTALKISLPYLRKAEGGGRVVFTSSGAATGRMAGWAVYNSTKAAMNSLCRTLGSEEPDITSVALRPGVVATEMQTVMRGKGKGHMADDEYERFVDLHKSDKLLNPDVPGFVMAKLALEASKELSGGFYSWDSDEMKPYRTP
ncbi:uncharacterized protein L969DRAFT_91607 [Mixia osmundae IAM 14324]|uniref:Protein OS-9 homolog n=1 Tax=Mixia osmundae (strain CBS 9802 / IAM 14324 / JCM 22182 / KY 12970) TaxID=764103 RepID=G7DZZ1_MIXOS|nr:uncharacterized protein L969DRAFT_91607 [Mixia osmundae IAM 14324]KEI42143.1 hypothetical protein L969DRAFT_91607 [Mixia osmundae IAM 14324]GAA96151.1 hypothetical protein E5Q_02812 [Mixia osmundae IAM 14324]